MAILQNSIIPAAAAAAPADDYTVDNSLKFDGSSSYLSRTFGAPTDNDKWTWACWVKRAGLGSFQFLFGEDDIGSGTDGGGAYFDDTDRLNFYDGATGGGGGFKVTTRKFRDVSSWYHLAVTLDGAAGALEIYVNGQLKTAFDTDTDPGTTSNVNSSGTIHYIGREASGLYDVDGYLADMYFVDGSIVAPEDNFIEKDSNGQWVPKEYTVSGDNSFHLPFSNTAGATAFVDSSTTLTHTITPTNATHTRAQKKVDGSSIYFDGTADYLTIPDSEDWAFSGNDFTIEAWIYPTAQPGRQTCLFGQHAGEGNGDPSTAWGFNSGSGAEGQLFFRYTNDGTAIVESDEDVFNLNEWSHIAYVRDGSSLYIYVNGTVVETATISANIDRDMLVYIGYGRSPTNAPSYFTGYIDELRVSKTARYDGSSFTDFGQDGGTISSPTAFSDDSDTLLLIHSDWNGGLGADGSGNFNDFTESDGVATHDQMGDTPSKNYCTLNPVDKVLGLTISEGNLKAVGSNNIAARGSIAATGDKFYWEVFCAAGGSDVAYPNAGFKTTDLTLTIEDTDQSGTWAWYTMQYHYGNATSNTDSSVALASAGGIVQVAVDPVNGKCWFGVDGSWAHTPGDSSAIGNPATGANPTYTGIPSSVIPYFAHRTTFPSNTWVWNFGQDPTFNNEKTSGQDSSQSEFYYAPPSGFKSLCTANLPAPALNNAKSGEKAFEAVAYEGDGEDETTSGQDIAVSFAPDLVWVKNRDSSKYHALVDTVRGDHNVIYSNDSGSESNPGSDILDITSSGFTVWDNQAASLTSSNQSESLIAWAWKAGTTTDDNSSVGNINSGSTGYSQSRNSTAGFSIVQYSSNDSPGNYSEGGSIYYDKVAHNLGAAPEMIIIKNRDDSQDWAVWHKSLSDDNELTLNSSAGTTTNGYFPTSEQAHTDTYFVIGGDSSMGGYEPVNHYDQGMFEANKFIAYLFRSVEGYSKIGSYSRVASASDSSFVYLGFTPRWLCMKKLGSSSWVFYDTERTPYNELPKYLVHTNAAESSYTPSFDILSNGFKDRGFWGASDASEYIYIAFGDSFKFSSAF